MAGRLTTQGVAQLEAVGRRLRQRLVDDLGLLDEAGTLCARKGHVRVTSTCLPRTIQSTQALLSGLSDRKAGEERELAINVPGHWWVMVPDAEVTEEQERRMAGVHICIYIERFRQAYDHLAARGLIWTNPRFAHLDTCDTWEAAVAGRQFRCKDIVDSASGVKLLELEHETRAVRHFQFMKDVYTG